MHVCFSFPSSLCLMLLLLLPPLPKADYLFPSLSSFYNISSFRSLYSSLSLAELGKIYKKSVMFCESGDLNARSCISCICS